LCAQPAPLVTPQLLAHRLAITTTLRIATCAPLAHMLFLPARVTAPEMRDVPYAPPALTKPQPDKYLALRATLATQPAGAL